MDTRGILRPSAVGTMFTLERRPPPPDLAAVRPDEMQALDKKMRAAVAKATAETHEILRRSIASGAAKPAR